VSFVVKICGVTCAQDALVAIDAGADAIGLNLVEGSPRAVSPSEAGEISRVVRARGRGEIAGVVADRPLAELRSLLESGVFDRLQLHGDEPPELLAALGSRVYKAVRIEAAEDVARAERYGGEWLLVDSKVPGALGGSGRRFDWRLVRELAARRAVMVAGGLTPDNVAEAIEVVKPRGVDVASGVERADEPRRKDPEKLRAFLRAARGV
jgi:phosphoribosylanthranilate isomerase